MNTNIYCSVNETAAPVKQLSRLTIAKITSGKQVSKAGFTNEQLLSIQRLANRIHKKEIVIAYR